MRHGKGQYFMKSVYYVITAVAGFTMKKPHVAITKPGSAMFKFHRFIIDSRQVYDGKLHRRQNEKVQA